jgi:hypothetical protein
MWRPRYSETDKLHRQDAEAAKENESFTAKDAKESKEKKSFTAKDAKGINNKIEEIGSKEARNVLSVGRSSFLYLHSFASLAPLAVRLFYSLASFVSFAVRLYSSSPRQP